MNKVLLVGRLTRDPELRTTTSGIAVARFTLAVSQNFTNRNGERGADFINCSVWERQASNIARYCRKGSLVSVEGRIRTSSYDAQDGTKRYTTEVVCDNVNFLSTRPQGEGAERNNSQADYSQPMPQNADLANNMPLGGMDTVDLTDDPFKSFGQEIALTSDDLPF